MGQVALNEAPIGGVSTLISKSITSREFGTARVCCASRHLVETVIICPMK